MIRHEEKEGDRLEITEAKLSYWKGNQLNENHGCRKTPYRMRNS